LNYRRTEQYDDRRQFHELRFVVAATVGNAMPSTGPKVLAGALWMAAGLLVASCTATDGRAGVAAADRPLMPTRSNGLVIRELRVRDDPAAIQAVLLRHADGEALDDPMRDRFQRNGMHLIRVPASEIGLIIEELGGALRDIDGWHGQAIGWRAISTWPVGPNGAALAIDGRIRRFVGGNFRLLVRAWTIPMETGPAMQLEFLADYARSARVPLGRVLGRPDGSDVVRFRSLSHEMLLEPGYAYVLTGTDPRIDWMDEPAPPDTPESPRNGEDHEEVGERTGAPERIVGPAVQPPQTLGQSLFCREMRPPCRELIVFIPQLPSELFPPGAGNEPMVDRGGDR
jgi:hypothetical protein